MTGRIVAEVKTQTLVAKGFRTPDAIVYDPSLHVLVAVNADVGELVLIDVVSHEIRKRISLAPGLEFAVSDHHGMLYVNEGEKNALAFVNLKTFMLAREVKLVGCDGPSGVDYDKPHSLIMSVCGNGVAEFVAASDGMLTASLKVAAGADAILFDPVRHVAFVPGGQDGSLTVIDVKGPRDVHVIQTLTTAPGSRLGAIDPLTGALYIPAAKFGPSAPQLQLPGMTVPGLNPRTFRFLVIRSK